MADVQLNNQLPDALLKLGRYRHLLVPFAFLGLIIVMVVPLPPAIMDILICANIALAAIVLMTTIYMVRPLDFSVFPALLLGTTLFRLVLNVATTRLILSTDATSPDDAAATAGRVIEAFGNFVAGDSVIVGVIIFLILIVVQFVVITKGATRMSEVAARFTLDAMPGKQMAIDADLSAGLIEEGEAKSRRESITREADFYGAMDGASKFVRGDAIAGIIITLVNIAGGFAIGALEKGWKMGESLDVFTHLTIGDGLVSQIPSFIIAIAAGFIVARTGGEETIGEEIPRQLTAQPIALYLIAGFMVVLSITPLPTTPLIGAAVVMAVIAWMVGYKGRCDNVDKEQSARDEQVKDAQKEQPVEELLPLDTLEIEIGYGMVPLVDKGRGGDLLNRISMIRRQLAVELGLVIPPVRIRDNMQLEANNYRVKLRGAVIGDGTVHPHLYMAMDSGLASGTIEGIAGREPAFGLEATWIEPELKQKAETLNYTVVDASSVLATHLTELIRAYSEELLTREEVNHLLEQVKKNAAKLVEETVPAVVKTSDLQKVLQNLLRERVPIRDMETILETLGDWSEHTKDTAVLTELIRAYSEELLTREEVNHLLEQVKKNAAKLVEETVPAVVKTSDLQKVLQNLLRERVPIRDMETILETLGDWSEHTKDTAVLTEYVRNSLRRTISSLWAETDDNGRNKLFCVTVDPAVEDLINGYIDRSPAGTSLSMPPQVATRIARAVTEAAQSLVAGGHQLVVLTSPSVRAQLKQILDTQSHGAVVLSYNEIVRDLDVESAGLVQLPKDEPALVGAA